MANKRIQKTELFKGVFQKTTPPRPGRRPPDVKKLRQEIKDMQEKTWKELERKSK